MLGDCLELMKDIPDESVDAVVTDPPYESMRRWEGIGTTARMGMGQKGTNADDPNKFFATITNAQLAEFLAEIYRVLKDNRHAYVMCDHITLPFLYFYIEPQVFCEPCIYGEFKIPFSNIKPLVWDKMTMGMGYHYRGRYEFVVMLDKGKNRRLHDLGISDVLQFKRVAGNAQLVPTAKPLGLMELLIKQSSEINELILDPFMGSGTTGVACVNTGRNFIGIEIDENRYDIAVKQVAEAQAQPKLI